MKYIFFALALCLVCVHGILVDIPVGEKRCVQESVRSNHVFTMDFRLFQAANNGEYVASVGNTPLRSFQLVITDNSNNQLYQSADNQGHFSFTPSYDGQVSICMTDTLRGNRHSLPMRAVNLKHVHGTTTSQYSEMAKREKLQVC